MLRNPHGYRNLSLLPIRRTIKITGHDTLEEYSSFGSASMYDETCRYSWVEWHVDKDSCGGEVIPNFEGFSDDNPAVEINGRTDIEEGTITEAYLAPDGDHWLFNGATGGGGGGGPNNTGFCYQGPNGIVIMSQQVCCDDTIGFHAPWWYVVWNPQTGCPVFFDSEANTLADAQAFAESVGVATVTFGACPT